MKTYRIKIKFFDGSVKWIQANTKKLQKAGNVCTYCALKFVQSQIKSISVQLFNESTSKFYTNVSYCHKLEILKNRHSRVKVTYKWGESINMYIGRSTGWIPCYLVIKRSDSHGGGGLLVNSIKNIQLV